MDDRLPIVRRLVSLMIDQGQLRELEDAYCRERPELRPDGALDESLDQMLPRSQYEALTTYIASQSTDHDDCLRTLYGSLTDGLEARYIQRQASAHQARRQHQDPVELAEDLGGDLQLASSHRDNGEEAALWLDRFPEMVRKRAGASPTPSGRRFTVDQVAKVLDRAQSDFRATDSYQAESQAAWCQALRERLTGGRPPSVDDPDPDVEVDEAIEQEHGGWADQAPGRPVSVDDADAAVDKEIEQEPEGWVELPTVWPSGTTSRSTLSRLRAATSSLGDDDSFMTLVDVANGPDDDYDPSGPEVIEAMQRLMDDELRRFGDRAQAHEQSAVREELWTHMVVGYRIGRHLLAEGRHRSPENRWPEHTSSWLVSYVEQAPQDEALAAILNSPDFSAALHYHSFSVAFLQSCDGKKGRARAWVSLAEDCGFLVAVAEDDLLCSLAEAEGATTSEPATTTSHVRGRARNGEKT
jgi:hypothetical protein